jgi:dihydrofolate synthase/folylpolyglutamate synthase
MSTLTYTQAVDFLFSRQQFTWKLGLERITRLLADLNNPHMQYPCVHIAGTNGKGSVTAMLDSVARAGGLKTGMYTSPHLISVRERIQVAGEMVTEQDFAELVGQLRPAIESMECTFFEAITAVALLHFANSKIDIAFLEVGLGGRLDATNVVRPLVSIITDINFDHTEHLGTKREQIAAEKAGIIKKEIPCVIGRLHPEAESVIKDVCTRLNSRLYRSRDCCKVRHLRMQAEGSKFELDSRETGKIKVQIPLAGPHQVNNACIVIAAIGILNAKGFLIESKGIIDGLKDVRWPGRFERVSSNPDILIDAAHNPAAIKKLVWMLNEFLLDREIVLILGTLQDKDYRKMIAAFQGTAKTVMAVRAETPRSLDVHILADELLTQGFQVQPCPSVAAAIDSIRQSYNEKQVVCITGSHYVIGEALQEIKSLTN